MPAAITGTGGVEISGTGIVIALLSEAQQLCDWNADRRRLALISLVSSTSSLKGNIYNFGTVDFNQSTSGTYSGVISGIGKVEISGGGAVTFTGLNTFNGLTLIDHASTLIGSTSSLHGQIGNSGVVNFNQSTAGTFSGSIGGSGLVEISGGGPVTFAGKNTYTGGTIVDANNTLIGTTDSLQGSIANAGLVQLNQVASGVYSGQITGSGRRRRFRAAGPIGVRWALPI